MENKKFKCSSEENKEVDANNYGPKCNIYICNKCEKHHKILFINHNLITLDNDITKIFTGFCKVENHKDDRIFL